MSHFTGPTWRRQEAMGYQESFHLNIRKTFFYSKNNHSLKQCPWARGRVPTTGGFQDVIEQGGR